MPRDVSGKLCSSIWNGRHLSLITKFSVCHAVVLLTLMYVSDHGLHIKCTSTNLICFIEDACVVYIGTYRKI